MKYIKHGYDTARNCYTIDQLDNFGNISAVYYAYISGMTFRMYLHKLINKRVEIAPKIISVFDVETKK